MFRVLKGLFSGRSDVFSAMFSHPETKENKNNLVEVEDAEPDTIEQVYKFGSICCLAAAAAVAQSVERPRLVLLY